MFSTMHVAGDIAPLNKPLYDPKRRGTEVPLAREQRRLAAIVAADVVGYSLLMGRDESGTLARLRARRSDLIDPAIAAHGGRIVKTMGDGLLLEFPSAVDATRCAIEVQMAMAVRNADVPQDERIVFRIGVNLGDIIIDGDDIHGDGVNVAARLEAQAPAGGIVLAGAVHDAVSGRVKATFEDLGELALKNVERRVRAYSVRLDGISSAVPAAVPAPAGTALALPDKPSIAVLPFQNMSGDPEQEYFADGIVEDIITALSRFRSLFVIARNSSFIYKGRAVDVKQVGRELGVRYVLEGSVRKAAGRLRVTAQLIDTATGAHIWADRLEGALEDVFELQDRITTQVVTAIAPRIEAAEIARARGRTGSLSGYDCYLRGLACLTPLSRDGIVNALRLFRQAIELDPNYPGPYAIAMVCYANRRGFGLVEDPEKEKNDAEALVQSALRVGRDDALTLSNAAWMVSYVLRDLQSGKRLIDQALELNPNLASAWAISGWINVWLGDAQTAVEHLTRGLRHDPYQTTVIGGMRPAMAHACFFLGRYEEALSWADAMLQLNPEVHPALRIAAASAAFAGRGDVAQRMAERLLSVDPAFRVSRLDKYLAPYQKPEFVQKYAEGLRKAGLPE